MSKLFPLIFLCYTLNSCIHRAKYVPSEEGALLQAGKYDFGNIEKPEDFQERLFRKAELLKIKNGEKVLSLGAGNGAIEVGLSLKTDSVKFYLHDIYPQILNKPTLTNILRYYYQYAPERKRNQFLILYGEEDDPNIPTGLIFDRIIIHRTFHELEAYKAIMDSLSKSLKSGGELVIYDEFKLPHENTKHPGCWYPMLSFDQLKKRIEESNFQYTYSYYPTGSFQNYHYFTKPNAKEKSNSAKNSDALAISKVLENIQAKRRSTTFIPQKSLNKLIENKDLLITYFPGTQEYLESLVSRNWKSIRVQNQLAETILSIFPTSNVTSLLYASNLVKLRYYHEARNILNGIPEDYPDYEDVIKLQRKIKIHIIE